MYGFIVEGFNDEKTLLNVLPDSFFVVTKGTRFNNRVRMDIQQALTNCEEVFLLTDPDKPGDLLAKTIQAEFPELKRIHLDAKECQCYRNNKWKIGVEHADKKYLKEVLTTFLKEDLSCRN